jgi:hypothetical protein
MNTPELTPTEKARQEAIRDMAREKYGSEGQVEIDSNARFSEGDDNGTYVQAWVWVSFADTPFDK